MGVDFNTHRARIGLFSGSIGIGVVMINVPVNFSRPLKSIAYGIVIYMLLIIAGVETNPGPGPEHGHIPGTGPQKADEALGFVTADIVFDSLGEFYKRNTQNDIHAVDIAAGRCSVHKGMTSVEEASAPEQEIVPTGYEKNEKEMRNEVECGSEDLLEDLCKMLSPDLEQKQPEAINELKGALQISKQQDVVNKLGLGGYFPSKISIQDIQSIGTKLEEKQPKLTDVPWITLKRLMMSDFRPSDGVLCDVYTKDSEEIADIDETSDTVPLDEIAPGFFEDDEYEYQKNEDLDPLDVFLSIFSCCDHMLKQCLVSKLCTWQLAVPLLFRHLFTNKLCLFLWPIRNVTITTGGLEVSVLKMETKIVSFLRIKRPEWQKSKFINELLRNQNQTHDTFFYEKSFLRQRHRKIADGSVEVAWYLPSEKNRNFNDVVTFANLRGDSNLLQQQVRFLRGITNVFVVMTDIENLDDEYSLKSITSLYTENAKTANKTSVIVLLTNSTHKTNQQIKLTLSRFKESIGMDYFKRTRFVNTIKADIKTGVVKLINSFLNAESTIRLEDSAILAKDIDLQIDEEAENALQISNQQDYVNKLGLGGYFPSKISIQDLLSIGTKLDEKQPKLTDVPWITLKRLMMSDFRARDGVLCDVSTEDSEEIADIDELSDTVSLDEIAPGFFEDDDEYQKNEDLDPLDVFLSIFSCCDHMLKQRLVSKLCTCQLAVPLLFHHLFTNKLCVFLWPIRNVTITTGGLEVSILKMETKIVSFLRLKRPEWQKSKFINELLRNQNQTHDIFFYEKSFLRQSHRKIADGLVEVAWYIPSEKNPNFNDVVTFVNLRGDSNLLQQQVRFLREITNVFVVMTDIENLDDEYSLKTITSLYTENAKTANKTSVLFLLTYSSHKTNQEKKLTLQRFQTSVGNDRFKRTRFVNTMTAAGKTRNHTDIKPDVVKFINSLLSAQPTIRLEDSAILAKEIDLQIDEEENSCCVGRDLAKGVLSVLSPEFASISNIRDVMTPLQGNIWITWTNNMKEMLKIGRNATVQDKDELECKMREQRRKQVEMCGSISPLMRRFVCNLVKYAETDDILTYFLQWLKLDLDEISREVLPKLSKKYHDIWSEYKSAKIKNESNEKDLENLKAETDRANTELELASFGLEHLFRELSQVYEAIMDPNTAVDTKTKRLVEKLPKIVAKLITLGYPFELMDGNALNIPLTWVNAVFNHLHALLNDKEVLTLSVLGMQSSGKSTLLNTMFGVAFSVSAGRCTKGVFLQLVPVDRNISDIQYEYILLIDTEGLKAPELGQQMHDHDNKLSTFVIGMGDITIINIKGENPTDVRDLLQIAVHGFLRLKLVNEKLSLKQSCVFIHQNVPAPDANERMLQGRQRFVDDLDEMTKEAARQETINDITAFTQVIDFDVEKNVWYFSDLWRGDPPMAPTNPGYSEKAQDVKMKILYNISKRKQSFLSFSDIAVHAQDLWKGILSDNFVFGFKNTLELKAYNRMESTYHRLIWELEECEYYQVQDNGSKALAGCESTQQLNACSINLTEDIEKELLLKSEEIEKQLMDFFETDKQKEIVFQWKQTKILNLNITSQLLISKAKISIGELVKKESLDLIRRQKYMEYESQINEKAKALANTFRGRNPTDDELEEKFNENWTEWFSDFFGQVHVPTTDIEAIVRTKLFENFHDQHAILNNELTKHPLSESLTIVKLECSITEQDMQIKFLTLQKSSSKTEKLSIDDCMCHAIAYTNGLFSKVETNISDLLQIDTNFQDMHIQKILHILNEGIEQHNETFEQYRYSLTSQYKVWLAVYVSRYVIPKFILLNQQYEKRHSFASKMDTYKEKAYKLFKQIVEEKTEELIAATMFYDKLSEQVIETVTQSMPIKIKREILGSFSYIKYHLIIAIMDDLAKRGDFEGTMRYVNDPFDYATKWIIDYTNKRMFAVKDQDKSRYAELATAHLHTVIESIQKEIKTSRKDIKGYKDQNNICKWISNFETNMRQTLILPAGSFAHVLKRSIKDIGNFQELVLEKLDQLEKNISEILSARSETNLTWSDKTPYKTIMDKIWGCKDKCPFCGEPCQNTDKLHADCESHKCIQHRPPGIRGTVYVTTLKLCIETCNFQVQSNTGFNCGACSEKCRKSGKCTVTGNDKTYHPFLQYKTYLPDWDIAPSSSSESCAYWKWFICTFQQQIEAKHHSLKFPDIPSTWKTIDKYQAIRSLREAYGSPKLEDDII